jgi:hypothetical protein
MMSYKDATEICIENGLYFHNRAHKESLKQPFFEVAEEFFMKAISYSDGDPIIYWYLSRLQYDMGNSEKGKFYLDIFTDSQGEKV